MHHDREMIAVQVTLEQFRLACGRPEVELHDLI